MSQSKPKTNIWMTLSIRPFFFLWMAQLISQIAVNMLTFVLGVFVYESTRSNTAVSLLYLVIGVPAIIFGTISGVYVDHLNKRWVLLITTLVRTILIGLLIFYHQQLWLTYLIVALVSVVGQFFVPAEAALIPKFVSQNLLISANSLFTLTFYSAVIGGFVIGGPLLATIGGNNMLVLMLVLLLISMICLFFLPPEEKISPQVVNLVKIKQDLQYLFKYIQENILIKQAIMLMVLAQGIISIFITLGPGFADKVLTIKITDASIIILGPAALGMILGAVALGTWGNHFRKRTLINVGIFLSGFILIFLGLIIKSRKYLSSANVFENIFFESLEYGILPISIFSFLLLGFGNSLIDISCNTTLQERSSDEVRGRIYGFLASLISGAALIPVIISGILADMFGVGKIIFALGCTLILFGLYSIRSNKIVNQFKNHAEKLIPGNK